MTELDLFRVTLCDLCEELHRCTSRRRPSRPTVWICAACSDWLAARREALEELRRQEPEQMSEFGKDSA